MPTELLFSYGTLQLEAVQMATFGRRLAGTPDVLPGFVTTLLEIDEARFKLAADGRLWSDPEYQIVDPSPTDRLHLALSNLATATACTLTLSASPITFSTARLARRNTAQLRPDPQPRQSGHPLLPVVGTVRP
jgi:hypothetical protein